TDVNDTPTATAQTVSGTEDTDKTITLAGDDGDPELTQTLTFTISALPATGALYQTADGTTRGAQITSTGTVISDSQVRVIFAPAANANGSPYATFQFTVSDNGTTAGVADPKTSAAATVTVNVREVNDTPTVNA